jgi:ATP:ADP antiporter, AAA family
MHGLDRRDVQISACGAVAFGALLASSSVFRPVRDALVLDNRPDQLPWLFIGTFLGTLVVSPAWSAALDRARHRRLVPIAFHVFAACALAFAAVKAADVSPITVGRVFYIWASVFNMFVVSVFWSLLADLLGAETARRLFGPIAAGGTLGALAGPALTTLLVDAIGVPGVLVLSAAFLEVAVIAVALMPRDRAAEPPPRPDGPFAGLAQLARSRYLAQIAGYVACTATAATFLYMEQAKVARAAFPNDEAGRTEFFAQIDLVTNAAAFVLQALLARPLLRWLGPGLVLALLPIVQLAGVSVVVLAPSIVSVAFAQIASRALTHGLTRPSRELLFTVVDRDAKYRAKNAIDTVALRLADVLSAWGHAGLVALGAGATPVVVAMAPLVALWLGLARALGEGFRRRRSS